jgi:hypothetical protein
VPVVLAPPPKKSSLVGTSPCAAIAIMLFVAFLGPGLPAEGFAWDELEEDLTEYISTFSTKCKPSITIKPMFL